MNTQINRTGAMPQLHSLRSRGLRRLWLTIVLIGVTLAGFSQSNRLETQQVLLNSVASYDANIRQSILTASQYPQVLTQLQTARENAQSPFEGLINSFGQRKQGWFYELTRFPDLMHTLATASNGLSHDTIDQLVSGSDERLHEAAWNLYRHHHDDLVQADNLNQQANSQFDRLIDPLDGESQTAFRQLLRYPDALLLLTQNIDLTTQLGNRYAANADDLNEQLASLHDSLAVQHDREVATYKNQIDADPEAGQELNQAAHSFAQNSGYLLPTGAYAGGMMWANPYSYWFGYPYWYGSPLWYPGAYWGSVGLSYGLGGFGLYGYGFPSLAFNTWFFNRGRYAYPHLYHRAGSYFNQVAATNRFVPTNRGFVRAAQPHFGTIGRAPMNTSGARIGTMAGASRSYAPRGGSNSYGGGFRGGYSGGSFRGGGGFHGGGGRR